MNTPLQINNYIASLPAPKRSEIDTLHQRIMQLLPNCKLWFLDGKNSEGKVVSNPNMGYGSYNHRFADGSTKPFYQIGMSANTSGISIYIMGIQDKNYLAQNFGEKLGKATVSGYCIKFKSIKAIDLAILDAAIKYGFEQSQPI